MASEKDFELLDDYVGNRLSAQERSAFEQKIANDNDLRNEFQLQEKIVQGLRNVRAAELKQMLKDIPLSSIPSEGMGTLTQVGLWIVAAGIAGAGLYYFFSDSEAATPQEQAKVAEQAPPLVTDEPANEAPDQAEAPATEPANDQPVPSDDNAQAVPPKTSAQQKENNSAVVDAEKEKEAITPATPSPIDVFDPSEELRPSQADPAENDNREERLENASSIVVEMAVDKRYNFHYQFKDDKLYLYGSFEKGLYEIMEFFSNNKRTMFLFYKENYYLLNEESDKVKALTAITDPALLQKLKEYRGN
jgi:hypothetical protein